MAFLLSFLHSAPSYYAAGDYDDQEDLKLVVELEDQLHEMFALDEDVLKQDAVSSSLQDSNGFAQIVQAARDKAAPNEIVEKHVFPFRRYKPQIHDLPSVGRVLIAEVLKSDVVTPQGGVFEFGVGESTLVAQVVGVNRYVGLDSNLERMTKVRDKVMEDKRSTHFRFVWGDLNLPEQPLQTMLLGASLDGGIPASQQQNKPKHLPKHALTYQLSALMAEEAAFDVYIVNGPYYKSASAVAAFLHASARQSSSTTGNPFEQSDKAVADTQEAPGIETETQGTLVDDSSGEAVAVEDTYDSGEAETTQRTLTDSAEETVQEPSIKTAKVSQGEASSTENAGENEAAAEEKDAIAVEDAYDNAEETGQEDASDVTEESQDAATSTGNSEENEAAAAAAAVNAGQNNAVAVEDTYDNAGETGQEDSSEAAEESQDAATSLGNAGDSEAAVAEVSSGENDFVAVEEAIQRRRLGEAEDTETTEEAKPAVIQSPVVLFRECHRRWHLPESLFEIQWPGRTGFCIYKRLATTTDEQLVALWNQYQDKM
eukprot:CAMPEP_0168737782 /NCGR_PEP_ID=MMETSP0724-20121128/10577_1 /TAXON_ID=265536 /ORGANISM="Amphiprora sp., Strain CCMP467" /LENGTH=541 /DNA_ID=CAMNT_0008785069 /DNA_START=125 /DNA_END=1750 /DNA_ORIENTATION=-